MAIKTLIAEENETIASPYGFPVLSPSWLLKRLRVEP